MPRKTKGQRSQNMRRDYLVDPETKQLLGSKPTELDWDLLKDLCTIQLTRNEICKVLHLKPHSLTEKCQEKFGMTFGDWSKQWRTMGQASLRRKLWKKAMGTGKDNWKALKFALENYLKMIPKQTFEVETPVWAELDPEERKVMKRLALKRAREELGELEIASQQPELYLHAVPKALEGNE